MAEPLDIMVGCCLPDRMRLLEALNGLSPGEMIEVCIENSEAVKAIVEKLLKNTGCTIIETADENGSSILTIKKEV